MDNLNMDSRLRTILILKWDCCRILPSDSQPCFFPHSKQGPDRSCLQRGTSAPTVTDFQWAAACIKSPAASQNSSWLSGISQCILQLIPNCPKMRHIIRLSISTLLARKIPPFRVSECSRCAADDPGSSLKTWYLLSLWILCIKAMAVDNSS